jgi:hypothetical protein
MPDKSYVTMEQHLCEVCGQPYDTGAILMDKRLRDKFDKNTITALSGMCEEHQKLHDDGFVAFVEITSNSASRDGRVKQEDAFRTGRLMHIRKEAAVDGLGIEIPDGMPFVFVDEDFIDHVQGMVPSS